jgi:Protein of unknown function (DUF3592)
MAALPINVILWRHPVLLGGSLGILAAVAIGVFASPSELQDGDSRILMAVVGAIFLIPGFILTAYCARLALRNVRQIPSLRFAWIAFTLFFTFAVAIGALSEWTAARRFSREGRSVNGTVLEAHPEDHDTLIVAYTISGVEYRSRSTGSRVARSYKAGDPLQVYYNASSPARGLFEEPRWQPGLVFAFWVLAAGVGAIWLVGLGGAFVLRFGPKIS